MQFEQEINASVNLSTLKVKNMQSECLLIIGRSVTCNPPFFSN